METPSNQGSGTFLTSRLEQLAHRVTDAARSLLSRGEEPTARAVRRALRGGSPNEIGPLLRAWRESAEGRAAWRSIGAGSPLPSEVADLCAELWQRASIAAQLEASDSVRSVESESTQSQLKALRDQLHRELVNYGELRAQSARHEASARSLASQLEGAERRERGHLRDLGEARARIAELEATVDQPKAKTQSPRAARPKRAPPGRAKPVPPGARVSARKPSRKSRPRQKPTVKKARKRLRRKARVRRKRQQ